MELVGAGLLPCVAYLAVGLRLLPRFRLGAKGAERVALAWILGTGVCSLGILLLRALGVPLPLFAAGVLLVSVWPLRRRVAGLPA